MRRLLLLMLIAPALFGQQVQDIRYGNVPAFLVLPRPEARGPRPAVIFMHWGLGDRHAFVDEARELAQYGVTSLLPDAPFNRPNAPKSENDDILQAAAEVSAGIDFLTKRKDVDPKRIAFVGLSYGAHVGALLAAKEPRLKALVLAGGLASNADAEKNPDLAPYDAEKWISKPHQAAVFLQFTRSDEYISREQAGRFIEAANAIYKWYEGGHQFNTAARADRLSWLAAHLGFTIPDTTYRTITPDPAIKSDIGRLGVVVEIPGMRQIRVRREIAFKPGLSMDVYFPFTLTPADRVPAIILVAGQSDRLEFQRALRIARFSTTLAQVIAARANRIVVVPDIVNEKEHDPADDLREVMRYLAAHADELQVDATQIGILTRSAGYSYGIRAAAPPAVKAIAVWYGNLADPKISMSKDVAALVVTCEHDFWSSNAAAEKFVAATGAQRIHLPDGDHAFEIFDDLEQSRDAIVRTAIFLREHLPVHRRD